MLCFPLATWFVMYLTSGKLFSLLFVFLLLLLPRFPLKLHSPQIALKTPQIASEPILCKIQPTYSEQLQSQPAMLPNPTSLSQIAVEPISSLSSAARLFLAQIRRICPEQSPIPAVKSLDFPWFGRWVLWLPSLSQQVSCYSCSRFICWPFTWSLYFRAKELGAGQLLCLH